MENELKLIKDDSIRKMVKVVLEKLPTYFWKIPASSTGKYHPKFSLNDGGLIRHTKVAVRIANDLLILEQYNRKFNNTDKDIIIAALMLHDGLKKGRIENEYTSFLHPLYMKDFILELYNNKELDIEYDKMIRIGNAIWAHMGEWNTNKYEKKELRKPNSELEEFVHMCDYLASRRYLDVVFDKDNNISEDIER